MKKSALILFLILVSMPGVLATSPCDLDVELINQDPYPAIPGDYVKLVFQIDGISNTECSQVTFELLEEYPLIFEASLNPVVTVNSGVYELDYSSFLIAPYKVRLDDDALDGDNPIEVRYKYGLNAEYQTKQFNLEVEDARVDFEIFVKDYDPTLKQITFEILNIGDSDVEGLTIEILPQAGIDVRGANTRIVGDLDSNEYTTADFDLEVLNGNVTLNIFYSDATNARRSLVEVVAFESSYFEIRPEDQKQTSPWTYAGIIVIVIIVGYYFYKRKQRRDKLKHKK